MHKGEVCLDERDEELSFALAVAAVTCVVTAGASAGNFTAAPPVGRPGESLCGLHGRSGTRKCPLSECRGKVVVRREPDEPVLPDRGLAAGSLVGRRSARSLPPCRTTAARHGRRRTRTSDLRRRNSGERRQLWTVLPIRGVVRTGRDRLPGQLSFNATNNANAAWQSVDQRGRHVERAVDDHSRLGRPRRGVCVQRQGVRYRRPAEGEGMRTRPGIGSSHRAEPRGRASRA